MNKSFISTREVADMLSVTETTVKRWADSRHIKCIKTLGGHRKYIIEDVEKFAEENMIPVSGFTSAYGREELGMVEYALYSKNYDQIIKTAAELALNGNIESLVELFLYLTKNRIKFFDIIDEIVQHVLENVGTSWESSRLKIEDEHVASEAIRTALSRLYVYLPKSKGKNTKAICACVEGEYHDIGIKSVAYELEMNGFNIIYLGANTPFQSIITTVKKEKPSYVFLSSTISVFSEDELIKNIKRLAKTASASNSKVIMGGKNVQGYDKKLLGCYAVLNSIKEVHKILRTKSHKIA